MAPVPSNQFHISLGDIKLSSTQKKSLNKALSSATLAELARLDLADGVYHRIPPEWLGIFIDRFRRGGGLPTPGTAPALPAETHGTTFTVSLGDIKLSPAQQRSMGNAINSATLAELGRLGIKDSFAVRIPRKEWFGIWLDRVRINQGRITGGSPR
ncbi:MAG: hypothetical protein AB7G11_11825 [Phycisphaerales bacterium]